MSPMVRLRVGELLLRKGLITEEQLEEALREQARTGKRLGDILVEKGFIEREILEKVLREYRASLEGLEDIQPEDIDKELAKYVPEKLLLCSKWFLLKKIMVPSGLLQQMCWIFLH